MTLNASAINTIHCVSTSFMLDMNLWDALMATYSWGEVAYSGGLRRGLIVIFVLSDGHACALQYTMLHLTGYKVSKNLTQFSQDWIQTLMGIENIYWVHYDKKCMKSYRYWYAISFENLYQSSIQIDLFIVVVLTTSTLSFHNIYIGVEVCTGPLGPISTNRS
jgi:hypothetical protein